MLLEGITNNNSDELKYTQGTSFLSNFINAHNLTRSNRKFVGRCLSDGSLT